MSITADIAQVRGMTDQPLNAKDKELVQTIYTRLGIFSQGNQPYHDAAREARQILRLRDPYQDEFDPSHPGARKPTLQLHTLKSTFNNVVADQMQNLPEIKLLPETLKQEKSALDLQDLVRYVMYTVNDYEAVHRRRAEDLYGPGTAITQIVWDKDMHNGAGDVALIRWPIEAFVWDPLVENIQDARAVMKISWHPLSWYEAHYPDKARYVYGEDGLYGELGQSEAQAQASVGNEEPKAALIEYWYRLYNADSHRYTINVAYCAGGALLEHYTDVYKHGLYPFVVDVHSIIEGSMAGEGLVTEMVPMMRYINRYARYIDTNARMSSKARMLVRENSGIDSNALADWSADMITGRGVTKGEDWDWLIHPPFNGVIAQQMAAMQNDLKMDSGANQFTRGESTAGVTSSKMLAMMQTAGGKITSLRTATLNQGTKLMAEQILWLIDQLYTKERKVAVTGRDGEPREVSFDRRAMFGSGGPSAYQVQIEVNQKSPARVQAQNDMFMEMFTMAAQMQQFFPLSSLLRLLNVDGKDRLLPIIEANEQTQQQMQALQQQNEQLTAQMEGLQKENQSLRTVCNQSTAALANMQAGGGFEVPQQDKVAQAGMIPDDVAFARNQLSGNMAYQNI